MAAEADGQEQIGEADTDARMQIQDIIESLNGRPKLCFRVPCYFLITTFVLFLKLRSWI